jgi:hypothetical protein
MRFAPPSTAARPATGSISRSTTILDGRYAGALETPICRNADPDVDQMIARLNRQTALRAQDIADTGRTRSILGSLFAGVGQFWTSYVWRQGLFEGEIGFLIALMDGLDPVLSSLRAREILKARGQAATLAAEPTRIGQAG